MSLSRTCFSGGGWLLWLAAAFALVAGVPSLRAEGGPWTYEGVFSVSRDAVDLEENTLQTLGLTPQIAAGLYAMRDRKLSKTDSDHLSFGLRREHYPDAPAASRQIFEFGYEYRHRFGETRRRQMRYRIEAAVATDPQQYVFSRLRLSAAYRLIQDGGAFLQSRLRIGYRDQNDDRFAGYDQWEVMADLSYFFRDRRKGIRSMITAYTDQRFADLGKFSYAEYGLRFLWRKEMARDIELVFRLSGFDRQYEAGNRHDRRYSVSLGPEFGIEPGGKLRLFAGYEDNSSTLRVKDYSGFLIGAEMRWQW